MISADVMYSEKWQKFFGSLEYKSSEDVEKIAVSPCASGGVEVYLRRFLAYMIYRHVACADSEPDMRARLGFALLSTSVLESMAVSAGANSLSDYAELARIYSEEIEYSESNTDTLIFEIVCDII